MYSVFTTVTIRVSDHDLSWIWISIRIQCQQKFKKLNFLTYFKLIKLSAHCFFTYVISYLPMLYRDI